MRGRRRAVRENGRDSSPAYGVWQVRQSIRPSGDCEAPRRSRAPLRGTVRRIQRRRPRLRGGDPAGDHGTPRSGCAGCRRGGGAGQRRWEARRPAGGGSSTADRVGTARRWSAPPVHDIGLAEDPRRAPASQHWSSGHRRGDPADRGDRLTSPSRGVATSMSGGGKAAAERKVAEISKELAEAENPINEDRVRRPRRGRRAEALHPPPCRSFAVT